MTVEIITGDVAEVVRELAAGRFDAVFSDPPYGIRFMGRRWDYAVPSAETWSEVLRVCKPGAPVLAYGGTKTVHRAAVAIEDGGFLPEDTLLWLYGQGKPGSTNRLKPAFEPLVLARRPWDGTIEESVAKWGAGLLAIDACRIAHDGRRSPAGADGLVHRNKNRGLVYGPMRSGPPADITLGRWPANVILDDAVAEQLDAQAGVRETHGGSVKKHHAGMGYGGGNGSTREVAASVGGASRFFYVAKVRGGEEAYANEHETKKPVKANAYFARLIRPEKPGALLVPYCGSGSEIVGALRAGWTDIVGIELRETTAAFARERIDAELSGATLRDVREGRPGLFGGVHRSASAGKEPSK